MPYTVITNSGELYHHGILGQKWGQRNGPPYPLGASDHSAREKAAGYTKSIKKARSEYTKSRNERYKQYKSTRSELLKERKANTKALKENRDKYENDHSAKEKYKSDLKKVASDVKNDVKQNAKSIDKDKVIKVAKIGATVAIAGLAAYGTYKVAKSGILANQRASARQQMRALRTLGIDARGTNFAALNRNANAARRVGREIVNYDQRALEGAIATRAISKAIDRGEQSALAIFDNLTNGHNSLHSIDNLVRSRNSNRLASEGEWLLEELLKG